MQRIELRSLRTGPVSRLIGAAHAVLLALVAIATSVGAQPITGSLTGVSSAPNPQPVTNPPAIQRGFARHDTLEEREILIGARAAKLTANPPKEVAPLPQQFVAPRELRIP